MRKTCFVRLGYSGLFVVFSALLAFSQELKEPLPVMQANANAQKQINTNEYGGETTLGVAIGGGGILGVPLRIYITEKAALELCVFYRPTIIIGNDTNDDISYESGPMLAGGFDFYFSKKYIPNKNRISMHGIFIKGGYSFSQSINSTMIGLGWAYERFPINNKGYSFSFELGPGVLFNDKKRSDIKLDAVEPALYWKVHWGWALKPKSISPAVQPEPVLPVVKPETVAKTIENPPPKRDSVIDSIEQSPVQPPVESAVPVNNDHSTGTSRIDSVKPDSSRLADTVPSSTVGPSKNDSSQNRPEMKTTQAAAPVSVVPDTAAQKAKRESVAITTKTSSLDPSLMSQSEKTGAPLEKPYYFFGEYGFFPGEAVWTPKTGGNSLNNTSDTVVSRTLNGPTVGLGCKLASFLEIKVGVSYLTCEQYFSTRAYSNYPSWKYTFNSSIVSLEGGISVYKLISPFALRASLLVSGNNLSYTTDTYIMNPQNLVGSAKGSATGISFKGQAGLSIPINRYVDLTGNFDYQYATFSEIFYKEIKLPSIGGDGGLKINF